MFKIALVSSFTLPFYCGNSILANRLQEGLTERGYDVSLFNSTNDKPDYAVQFSPHLVHSFNAERTSHWMKQFINRYKAFWVVTLTGTDYSPWSGIKDPPLPIKESLEKADRLVVFHKEAKKALLTSLPQLKDKIHVIPQGVAPSEKGQEGFKVREKFGIKLGEVVFLMVAGIRPVKNIPLAIEAFYEVEQKVPNVSLLHVGPVMDKKEADRIVNLSKNLKCFRSLGQLPPAEVRELISAADVFVNTSFYEGMSGAILEAMAGGLPVLASSTEGNQALVKDKKNGLLFPVEDRQSLTRAAIKLARNPSLRKELGDKGKNIIAQHHSEKKELDLLEQLYQRFLTV